MTLSTTSVVFDIICLICYFLIIIYWFYQAQWEVSLYKKRRFLTLPWFMFNLIAALIISNRLGYWQSQYQVDNQNKLAERGLP